MRASALLSAVLLVAGLLVPGVASAAPPASVQARIGSEYRTWRYGAAESRAGQFHLPVDLFWNPVRALALRAGGDFASSARQEPGRTADFATPAELHGALESRLLEDRVRLAVGGRWSLAREALSPEEIWVAEALEATALEFPVSSFAWGNRISVQGAGQLLRRRNLIVQGGAGYELRDGFDVRAGEQSLDPGDLWSAGGGVIAAAGALRPEASVLYQRSGEHELSGGIRYRGGAQVRFRAASDWFPATGVRARAEVSLLAREQGSAPLRSPLDRAALRGGNVLHGRLLLSREGARWGTEFSLGGAGVRGLPGELGHATWFEPGVALSRAGAFGTVSGSLRGSIGEGRSGSRLQGLAFSLSWRGSWLRPEGVE